MKILALMLGLSASANAAPYFRLMDPAHPVKVVGAFIDPASPENTSAGTAVALITHSTKDGCFLPSVVCEDWSPLMAGLAVNAGRVQFSVGPAINLAPVAKAGLLGALNVLTAQDSLPVVKSLLGSGPSEGVSVSFGPALAVSPVSHGVIIPLSEWQGKFRLFAGAELKF